MSTGLQAAHDDQEEPPQNLSVAVCQLTSIDDVENNLAQIFSLLRELEAAPPELVCFPENALFMRIADGAKMPTFELKDDVITSLSQWAIQTKCAIHLGSVATRKGDKVFSSSLFLAADGAVKDCYQKIHLFDVDVDGHRPMRESDVYTSGATPSVLQVNGWKLGLSICYDLRFSELYSRYAKLEVDAILIPSSFLVPTGAAHWDVLTRARAIESQAYVLAAAQGGIHHGKNVGSRATYGHSAIIDPWGQVVAAIAGETQDEKSPQERILRAELSRERITSVRKQIPMKNHRRL